MSTWCGRLSDGSGIGKKNPRSFPSFSLSLLLTHANVIKQGQIDTIAAYAHQNRDMDLLDKTKKIQHNCRKLVQDGMLSDEDNYLSLRKDIIQELLNYELHITKSTQDLDRLKQVRTESTFWI